MASSTKARLFLVDGSGYIFRAYHALPPLTRASDGAPVGAVSGFCNMLWKFLEDMKTSEAPTHLAVIFDKSEHTFRNELYSEYKAHRPPAPEDLVPQFPLIREAVRAFGVACIEQDGFEADDLIATYARRAAKEGATVKIVSSDKDLMQLVSDGVIELYDPMKQKPLGPDAVFEKFGVTPDKVIDVQALIGDSVDNVPGCPGVGPKTAAELITTYGSLDALLSRLDEIKQPKRREALMANVEQIKLSRTLVTLRDDVETAEAWDAFAVREPTASTLLQFLDAMEFRTLARRVREKLSKETGAEAPPPETAPQDEAPIKREAYVCIRDLATLQSWIARARERGVLALDIMADGIDASRVNLIGVSLALGPNEAAYIPLAHGQADARAGDLFASEEPKATLAADSGPQIPLRDAIVALKPLLEDQSILKVGHNIKFDIALLARQGVNVAPYDDVLLISYVLSAGQYEHSVDELSERILGHAPTKYEEVVGKGRDKVSVEMAPVERATTYAAEDSDVTLRLWRRLKPQLAREQLLTVYETLERPLPAVLGVMERAGVKVDPHMLSRLSGDFAQRMLQYEQEAYGHAGKEFNIGSPKQLGDILFGEMKLSGGSKTKTGAWSTDATVLEELADQHPLPRTVLDWRQLSKLRSTYTEALREAIADDGRVHTTYALAASLTGRLASNDPNLQNIPIRTEEGRRIREAFIAEPGHMLVSADYSQIELRLLAHVAEIPQLRQAFADGVDIHAMTASEMFGVPVAGMPSDIRRQAKAINFGIIYGISAFGLARNLGIEREEANAYIKRYFERFPGIRDYMEATKAYARANGYVKTIFGRRIWIAGIKSKTPAERAFAERQSINAPLQGAAADIIRRAMVRMDEALGASGLKSRMLLQVHDELVFEAPEGEVDVLKALAKRVMEAAPHPAAALSIPLTVEANSGKTWGAAH
ncbi:MAG TPA: DNA polymerase I [Caulobacterales bacterium]|nr:DNA polymerase I [Caulobacterales bacterium]